jgi:hypothetical protein
MSKEKEVERQKSIELVEQECQLYVAEFREYNDYVEGWVTKTIKTPPTLSRMEVMSRDLETNRQNQKGIKRRIWMLSPGAEFSTKFQAEFERIFKELDDAQDKLSELIRQHKANVPPPLTASAYAKLENLQIPKFSGNYEDWQSFHDLFQALVDSRPIQGSAKLNYLLNALEGPAKAVISSFEITDSNYDEAWSYLKSRFNVKREIVFSHIRTFDGFKPFQEESTANLRSLADAINKLIRTLKVQGIPVDTWDLILIFMALKKLDPESRKQ